MTSLNKARLEILWAMAHWAIVTPFEATYYKREWGALRNRVDAMRYEGNEQDAVSSIRSNYQKYKSIFNEEVNRSSQVFH